MEVSSAVGDMMGGGRCRRRGGRRRKRTGQDSRAVENAVGEVRSRLLLYLSSMMHVTSSFFRALAKHARPPIGPPDLPELSPRRPCLSGRADAGFVVCYVPLLDPYRPH